MNCMLSARRREAASTGAVPSASAATSCSTACALSSKRSSSRLSDSGRALPITLTHVGGGRNQLRGDFAHGRRALLRLERGIAAVEHRLRLVEQRDPRRSSRPGPLSSARQAIRRTTCRRRSRSATRSSCARDSASESKAGADPRTAAPACNGRFCESAESVARCSPSWDCWLVARPKTSNATAASAAETSATRIRIGCSRTASNRLVIFSPGQGQAGRGFRTPRPAGIAGSRAGSAR